MNNQEGKPTVMFHRLLKRQQQSITDLHTALKPLLTACHASGILPITNTLNSNTYGTSRLWVMYSSVVLVTHLTLSYIAFRSTFTETTEVESSSGITNLGYRISAFSSVGLCTVFLTITLVRRLKIARFLKTVHLVTTSLMKTGVKFSYVRTYLLFHCQIVIGILLCVIVSYSTTAIYARDNVTNFLSRLISSLVVYVLACLFTDCLLLMYQRFVIINTRINMIHQVVSNDSGVLDEIRVLANCHDMLCDAADYVNDAFMLQLLFFVLVVFITGLFTVFNNIKAVYRTTPMDNDDIMELIRHSIWTVYNSAVLTIMMMACTTTCNQANDTGKHIHKLLININDNSVNQMLKTFSLQVMHRRLHFHACGMFTFDYTLLFSLVAAGTTYIVILVQFDQTKIEEIISQDNPENITLLNGSNTV